MGSPPSDLGSPSRLRLLLDHFSRIEDAREPQRVAFPMAELLLLAVCGTIADCDDYDAIAVGARAISISCGAFCPITMACRADAG